MSFPKDSAFKQEEDRGKAASDQENDASHSDLFVRNAQSRQPIPDPHLVSRTDIEELYQRLDTMVTLANGGNMRHASIKEEDLADLRDLVYRNLP